MTTATSTRAEALEELRIRLAEWVEDATELLHGTGEIHTRARHGWLLHLDRALGCEETCTVDDTIEELRGIHD